MQVASSGIGAKVVQFSRSLIDSTYRGPVRFTPEDAANALGLNINNRRKRPQFVDYLVRQIHTGEWQADHPQPIVFSDKGRIIDGQHRLFAIMESKTTVIANVVFGARDELREYIDTGISRSLDDRVAFVGDHELNRRVGTLINSMQLVHTRRCARITPAEAMSLFLAHKPALLFVAPLMEQKIKGITRSGVMVALSELFERDRELAQDFAQSLLKPDGEMQQARMLRDWLLRNCHKGGGQFAVIDSYGRSVSCMQAALEGREIKVVRASEWR